MNHFKIHDVEVDVARCSILKAGKTNQVEPKSMAVLQYLAVHHHQVISQEALFTSLWPKSTFSPGSVQRCIAQLRKALDDDSKNSTYIKTHPKRGYSLDIQPVAVIGNRAETRARKGVAFLALAMIAVLTIYGVVEHHKNEVIYQGLITPITSSSDYDFYPAYSPDGHTLAFVRQKGEESHIHLKDTQEHRTIQLSNSSEDYQALTWANDGKGIFYVVRDINGDRVEYLSTANLGRPGLVPTNVFSLEEEGRIWRVEHYQQSLIYMHAFVPLNQAPQTQVNVFDLPSRSEKVLLKNTQNFTPYRISLSPDKETLAIAGENAVNQIEIRLFDLTQQTLGDPIKSLALGFTEISWHPEGKKLLLHHMNSLYLLSLNGDLQPLPYLHYQNLYNPQFHPDASHIVFTVTEQDQDIYRYEVNQAGLSKVVDSSGQDNLASLSPDSDSIAFVSSRSGHQQVYIQDNNKHTPIFQNDAKALIYRAPVWSPDGQSITFSAGTSLFFYNIELQMLSEHRLDNALTSVLDWYSDTEHLLIVLKKQSVSEFAKYDISRRTSQAINRTGVNTFARLDSQDKLVFVKDKKILTLNKDQSAPIVLTDLPEDSIVFPSTKGVVFQQGLDIFLLDDDKHKVLVTNVADSVKRLIDVSDDGKVLLFSSNNQQTAKLVSFQ